jgi:hypothetical protein
MSGGEIYDNIAFREGDGSGGGVYVGYEAAFTMSGGKIYGNTSSRYGGGVYVNGTFTMTGGEISGNSFTDSAGSYAYGGGVYVAGTFTMENGEISGNSAAAAVGAYSSASGGGVYITGTFAMSGGEIFGNSVVAAFGEGSYTTARSGGVSIGNYDAFAKTGGTIYGYTSDPVRGNKVIGQDGFIADDEGHAISGHRRIDATVGPNDKLFANYPNEGDFSGWDE